MGDTNAIVNEFIAESRESLERLDCDLIELESNPAAKDRLASIFRTVHSIKGATGFLGFAKLGKVAHVGESLLSRLRDGILVINPQITSGLLALVDYIRQVLSNIELNGVEGDSDCTALVENLNRLQEIKSQPNHYTGSPESPAVRGVEPKWSPASTAIEATTSEHEQLGVRRESSHGASANGSVRVDVSQLDKLMNLVGELVLARNELLQFGSGQQNAVPLGTSQRLNAITADLQDEIMKVRMQRIENVWNKFPRLVRDLAFQAGKNVRLEMKGNETELDKTLIEASAVQISRS